MDGDIVPRFPRHVQRLQKGLMISWHTVHGTNVNETVQRKQKLMQSLEEDNWESSEAKQELKDLYVELFSASCTCREAILSIDTQAQSEHETIAQCNQDITQLYETCMEHIDYSISGLAAESVKDIAIAHARAKMYASSVQLQRQCWHEKHVHALVKFFCDAHISVVRAAYALKLFYDGYELLDYD